MSIQYKISFLILNYETYWETLACVQSIFETMKNQDAYLSGSELENGRFVYDIVIVDNGSKNDSVQKLSSEFKNTDGIYILDNGINLGFAKGNNQGFKYAKERLNPDFIIMLNSDILMTDDDFCKKIVSHFEEKKFAVAGPAVRLVNGQSQNPGKSALIDKKSVEKAIYHLKSNILLCKIYIEPFLAGIRRLTKKKAVPILPYVDKLNLEIGEQLHGSFLIFSKIYIEKFDGLYDKTFLYCEEVLLRFRCLRAGLDMYYLGDISAVHKESRTEKFIGGNIRKRHLRRYKNMLESVEIVKDYLENENDGKF